MAKKNLFERMGLIQSEEKEDVTLLPADMLMPEADLMAERGLAPQIDTEAISYGDDFIKSIYAEGSVTEDNSIFKIKAFMDVLPAEMTTLKKQTSIAGILQVNGIDVDELILDGQVRQKVLDATRVAITDESLAVINEAESDIENLKGLIEKAEATIANAKKRIDDSTTAIKNEIAAIDELLEFADGIVKLKEEK